MWFGLFTLLFGQFLGSGILTVLVKIGLLEFPPFLLSSIRFIIATIGIYILFAKRNNLSFLDKELGKIFPRSLLFAGNIGLFAVGLQFTTVTMSQIMYLDVPIIVMIFAHFYLNERITIVKIMGFIIALLGMFFLFSQSLHPNQQLVFGTPLGNFLIFIGSLLWSLYILTSRKASKHSTVKTTFANMLFAAVSLSLITPLQLIHQPFYINNVTFVGITSIIVLGIGTVFQYIAIQFGIKHTSATTVSFVQYLAPIFAAIVAVPVVHEKITFNLILGGIFVFIGVFFATTYSLLKKK